MPVFARSGAILPLAPYMDYSTQKPLSPLELDVYAGDSGSFSLYEDAGRGFGYQQGQFTRTLLRWNQRRLTLTIGPARGGYPGRLRHRAYELRLIGVGRPRAVLIDGARHRRWSYARGARTLTLSVRPASTRERLSIRLTCPTRRPCCTWRCSSPSRRPSR
jgi:hypothetical protein